MRIYLSLVLLLAAEFGLYSQAQPPSIIITNLSPYGAIPTVVGGQVQNLPAGSFKIATMILVEGYGWFAKPDCNFPFTGIGADGTWQATLPVTAIDDTASEVSAFVVPESFSTNCNTSGETLLVQLQNAAIASIIAPRPSPYLRIIRFAGIDWWVKTNIVPLYPGPTRFSESSDTVSVDANGRLHLKIVTRNGIWIGAEIVSMAKIGRGTYKFYLDSPVGTLDPNVVVGMFTWSNDPAFNHREIDVELSRFGNPNDLNNAQFVVQPYLTPGNVFRFLVSPGAIQSAYSFEWLPSQVNYKAARGPTPDPADSNLVLAQWSNMLSSAVVAGDQNLRLNLWLVGGLPPSDGKEVEVIVRDVQITPAPVSIGLATSPAGLTATVDGVACVAPCNFASSPGNTHLIGVPSPQSQVAGTRYVFRDWSDGSTQIHSLRVPSSPASFAANFSTQYQLVANVSGSGGVTPATNFYAPGQVVQLHAAASPGFLFDHWVGPVVDSGKADTAVTVNSFTTVTAFFVAAPPCTYAFGAPRVSLSGQGDVGRVRVSTRSDCSWSATPDSTWITVSSGTPVKGSGSLQFSVGPNDTGSYRVGQLVVGGERFYVIQGEQACPLSLSPQNLSIEAAGATNTLSIGTDASCSLLASAAPTDWISPLSTLFSGSLSIPLGVSPNAGALPRTGSVWVAGLVTQIVQKSATPLQVFDDVVLSHQYFDYIWLLRENKITSGCSPTQYCPENPTTRGQMAVFIIRSVQGGDTFDYPSTPYFTDVPSTHPYFPHIQKMKHLGITSGCTATTYCPDDPTTRGQMAVFLIRGRYGLAAGQAVPSTPVRYFTDVPSDHPYFAFIQKMRDLGITAGCSATSYCPDALTTRGQMATFLIRTFFTP